MDFGFAIRMDFAMNTDKLNLVNLVGKVMDKIVKFVNLQKIIPKGQTAQILALRS